MAFLGSRRVASGGTSISISISINISTNPCSRFGLRAQLELVELLARPDQSQQVAHRQHIQAPMGDEFVAFSGTGHRLGAHPQLARYCSVVAAWIQAAAAAAAAAAAGPSLAAAPAGLHPEMLPPSALVST